MISIEKFFGTPWCSDCKRAKQFLGEQRIPYSWIDIDGDEEGAKFVESINDGKRKVPTMVFSDGSILVEPSNAELAEKLGLKTDLGHVFHDVAVIGGGPAGLTTALYLARDGFDVVVIEKGSLGGQASFTEKLDNYPGFPDGISGAELAERIVQQCERFGVEFLKATDIVKVKQKMNYLECMTSSGEDIGALAVVVATGSKYKKLEVPGEDDLIGYKLHFCATCDGPFYRDKTIAVIGNGNSALEESVFLARFAKKVNVYSRSDGFKASQAVMDKAMDDNNIFCFTNLQVKEVLVGTKKALDGLLMTNTVTGEESIIKPDGVFLFIGLTPNCEPVNHLINKSDGGFILTESNMMTKTKGLFAAGDCREGSTKQAVAAMGEGAATAIHIRDYLRTH